jgi:hypothetical protein
MSKFWDESEVAYKIIERLIPPKSVGRILIELNHSTAYLIKTEKDCCNQLYSRNYAYSHPFL